DVRYSMIPNQIAPMWGLIIDEKQGTNEHAAWWASRDLDDESLALFEEMLLGHRCTATRNGD
ncbi:MAG: metal-dependent hydrolase, partial [Pseudomonadota bacterium]|nr:metal-dependent hydrolase [Pseudomonadota bacterium]